MKNSLAALALVTLASTANAAFQGDTKSTAPTSISFPAKDGLKVHADLYLAHEGEQVPFIVLFHQAGWSRGEYLEIAPRLNQLGFNCMAVDQCSGGAVNGIKNLTHGAAKQAGLGTDFPDAMPDMLAALEWARAEYTQGKLIAWGSSYSSALVLRIAGQHPKLVDGVLSFSPGDYFGRFGKSKTWIAESASSIACPVWITSAKKEREVWMPIFKKIPGDKKHSFLPASAGNHGSRALWQKFKDSGAYWTSVEKFLTEQFLTIKKK